MQETRASADTGGPASGDAAEELWLTRPLTPTRPAAVVEASAPVNGIELYFAECGAGPPVLLLHGGLSNSDCWGNQIPALADRYRVIVVDSRGHGRSTRDTRAFSYELMATDVVALLDHLRIPRADMVGWSDGGIIGLALAMSHPDRIGKLFAFGTNATLAGLKEGFDKNPTFAVFLERAGEEYRRLSPTPGEYEEFLGQIGAMWSTQPNWTADQLAQIRTPVAVVAAEHDEVIRGEHARELAEQIPGAELVRLPGVSHFAPLQNPAQFNAAVLRFLGG